jgi:nicotinamide mononucleotide transporter
MRSAAAAGADMNAIAAKAKESIAARRICDIPPGLKCAIVNGSYDKHVTLMPESAASLLPDSSAVCTYNSALHLPIQPSPRMNDPLPLFGFATTPLELVSFLLALITVALNIRQNHWAWLFSIVSSALYAVVFFGASLYGDMSLQFVFVAVSVWGWYQWLHGGEAHQVLRVSRLSRSGRVKAAIGWLAAFGAIALFLKTVTDTDVPYADGFLTAGSLLGQLLLSRKKLENWHVWIIVDLLYIGLYVYKGLMLTAILYAVFVVMAAIGLRAWKKALPRSTQAAALDAASAHS